MNSYQYRLKMILVMSLWIPSALFAHVQGISYQPTSSCIVMADRSDDNIAIFVNHLQKSVSTVAPVDFLEPNALESDVPPDHVMTMAINEYNNCITLSLCSHDSEAKHNTFCHPGATLSKKYFFKNQLDLLSIANQWGDLLIEHVLGFQGSLSYPLAYVEYHELGYHLIVSDIALNLYTSLYQTPFPIISLNWSPDAHYLAFIELKNSGSVLQILNIQTQEIRSLDGLSYISSPCFSKDGRHLYYISDQSGYHQLSQYHLETQKHEILTLDIDCLVDVNIGWDDYHLILSSNRAGSYQIYEFNLLNKKFKRLTFTYGECLNGILSEANHSLFYSLLTKEHSLLMRRSFVDHQTHYISIDGKAENMTAPPHPHIICFERMDNVQKKRIIVFKSLLNGRETVFDCAKDCYNPCWSPQPGLV